MKKNLKGTWKQALFTFFGPLILVLSFRIFVLEPFVIPSGSMIPTLLVHDHVMVLKGSFGIKSPFSDRWWVLWRTPQRGDIVVFRYPNNRKVFYIKRVVGLPGDRLVYENHQLTVNDQIWPQEKIASSDVEGSDVELFRENNFVRSYLVRHLKGFNPSERTEIDVPEKKYFVMGDNRDQSADSRVWGFVPEEHLIGRAWVIWLSCENTLTTAPMICDPAQIRWPRLFSLVDKIMDIK